jgi:hypothetical protein
VRYYNDINREDVTIEMYYDTIYIRILKERKIFINNTLLKPI